jgi:hypothetical protein
MITGRLAAHPPPRRSRMRSSPRKAGIPRRPGPILNGPVVGGPIAERTRVTLQNLAAIPERLSADAVNDARILTLWRRRYGVIFQAATTDASAVSRRWCCWAQRHSCSSKARTGSPSEWRPHRSGSRPTVRTGCPSTQADTCGAGRCGRSLPSSGRVCRSAPARLRMEALINRGDRPGGESIT